MSDRRIEASVERRRARPPRRASRAGWRFPCLLGVAVLAAAAVPPPPAGGAGDPVITERLASVTAEGGGETGDFFGSRLAIDGSTLAVGASGEDPDGWVHLFERDAGAPGAWGRVARITGSDASRLFGDCVALDGDTLAALAHASTGDGPASVYVFERDAGGPDAWGETAGVELAEASSSTTSPRSPCALEGDTLVVGIDWDDEAGENAGAAFVLGRDVDGPGAWGQVAKLLPEPGSDDRRFGRDVALSGTVAAVAVPGDDEVAGVVHLYERDAGGPDAWGEVQRLEASDPADLAGFGTAVTFVEGPDLVAAGSAASGRVYVFALDPDAGAWFEVATLSTDDPLSGGLGTILAASRGDVIAGDPTDDEDDEDAGAVYAFGRQGGGVESWLQLAKLRSSQPDDLAFFGIAVAADGPTVVAGESHAFGDPGHADVFTLVRFGGLASGVTPLATRCSNLATGESRTWTPQGRLSWDCEEAGLPAEPGDGVLLAVVGDALADQFAGEVAGIDPTAGRCRNRTTGQVVDLAFAGERTWDCVAAGLTVAAGDRVLAAVRGDALLAVE